MRVSPLHGHCLGRALGARALGVTRRALTPINCPLTSRMKRPEAERCQPGRAGLGKVGPHSGFSPHGREGLQGPEVWIELGVQRPRDSDKVPVEKCSDKVTVWTQA